MASKVKKVLIITNDKNLREVLSFCFDGWGYDVFFKESMDGDITPIKKMSPDIIIIDIHSAGKANLEICRLLKDDFITAPIPVITLINKRQLKTELLNLKQGVDDYLIKPPDPLDLRVRVEMAMRRCQYNFYASPLTGLPSGRTIEENIKDRLKKGEGFSFAYLDIDGFKYFNDVYGYLKGDRAIMQTAYILYTAVKRFGNKDDFMGHIGGDDFVFITTPDRYRAICKNITELFDRIMPFHYQDKDREQGYIVAKDRTNKIKNIPLMSISIAVVTRDAASQFRNTIEINEKVAEVKRYLKTFSGSKFMEDRRNRKPGPGSGKPEIHERVPLPASYKPIGYMLVERRMLSPEKLDEALCLHWRRGIMFGEILQELGYVRKEDLDKTMKECGLGNVICQ
jgi:diguanylate cyclase (GGDEF)-like protein